MPFPALLLIIAAVSPLVGCLVLLFLGRRLGTPLVGYVGTFFAAISFVCSGWGLMRWVAGGTHGGLPFRQGVAPIVAVWNTAPTIPGRGSSSFIDGGIYIDSLTVLLFVTISLGLLLVHIFATRSMRREPRLPRFFTVTALASFAVLGLLLSASLLHCILFLELLTVCGSLLIGFRIEREALTRSAMRVFVVNRVGDVGLFVGLGLIFAFVGKLTWPDLWLLTAQAVPGTDLILADGSVMPAAALTIAGVALFFGAAARCAQFPLHVWAADAAEGAASSCGLVFTLTQAVGAAFLIARIFPVLTPSARLLIAIVGVTTVTIASLIAIAQSGIKAVLTWLSASQFGLIVLAFGVGSWSGATFHLVAFCFFQLLLFMAAGAVIRAARGETDMSRFGALARKMPATAVITAIALLSAAGIGAAGLGPSGYHSRGLVLRHAAAFASLATSLPDRSRAYWAFFWLPVLATCFNTFAMTRWWMLTFAGRPRDRRLYNHAREAPTLLWPMGILAVMTILAGSWLGVDDVLSSSIAEAREGARRVAEVSYPQLQVASKNVYSATWPAEEPEDSLPGGPPEAPAAAKNPADRALQSVAILSRRWPGFALALGLALAAAVYVPGPRVSERLLKIAPVRWTHTWLRHRMYFDEFYDSLFATLTTGLADLLARIDRNVTRVLSRMLSRS